MGRAITFISLTFNAGAVLGPIAGGWIGDQYGLRMVYLPQPLTPNFLRDQHGLSLSAIGTLGSISSLGNVALNFMLGQIEARTGFLLGQMGVALFTILLWRGTGFEWFALGHFMLGGFRALRSLGVAQVQPFVHESQMGLAYGITETVGSATVLLGPPLAGYLYTRDPALMYPVGLVLIGFGLGISMALIPRLQRT